ncbi:MAG: hypothetical protein QOE31_3160 [Solirubrobacteraceae bacterium]|jgi:hypothetical protein|nr:hypothetical protein [Solirubrobacteraceae bacterium]
MQRITITQFSYEPGVQDFVGTVTGVIEVDEEGARLRHGGEGWLRIRVPDPQANGSLGAEDDPLRWAELLPEFVGGGDTEVAIEEVAIAQAAQSMLPDVAAPALAALAAAVQPH